MKWAMGSAYVLLNSKLPPRPESLAIFFQEFLMLASALLGLHVLPVARQLPRMTSRLPRHWRRDALLGASIRLELSGDFIRKAWNVAQHRHFRYLIIKESNPKTHSRYGLEAAMP